MSECPSSFCINLKSFLNFSNNAFINSKGGGNIKNLVFYPYMVRHHKLIDDAVMLVSIEN